MVWYRTLPRHTASRGALSAIQNYRDNLQSAKGASVLHLDMIDDKMTCD